MEFEVFKALFAKVCGEHHEIQKDTDLFKSGIVDSLVLVELLADARRQPGYQLNYERLGCVEIRTPADFIYVFEKV